MIKRSYTWYVIFVLFIASIFPVYAATKSTDLPEIHLLVDVSGSMKQTDPQNLRITAIKLFNYLISQRAKMSITLFATNVEEMIPLKNVTLEFQNIFVRKKSNIRSDGAWTNIDAALNAANKSWGTGKRIIVLLTDGKLDLGSDLLNTQSTQKLNNITIKELQRNRVQVYTIGLSNLADKKLLANISLKTNAVSQIVISALDLDRVLYTVFTAAIEAEGTPITKNDDTTRSIIIDKSINDFTLIFKKALSDAHLYLTSPAGETKNLDQEIDNGKNSVSINNYQFIKINKPMPGEWVLAGPAQEMERVLILTNVILITNFSSGVYFNDEYISLIGHLEESNKLIDSSVVLENMKMSFNSQHNDNKLTYDIPYTEQGIFKTNLNINMPEGSYTVVWTAKNKYLSREHQYLITVQSSPFKYRMDNERQLTLELLKPDLIKVEAVIIKVMYQNTALDIPVTIKESGWMIDFTSFCKQYSFSANEIALDIQAQMISGRTAQFNIPINASFCPPEELSSQLPALNIKPHVTKAVKKEKPKDQDVTNKTNEVNQSNSLLFVTIVLLLIVLIVIGIVVMGIYHRKKINKIREQSL